MMTDLSLITTNDLKRLRREIDDAIGVIEGWPQKPSWPVNWADLSCREAAHIMTDEGESYLQVLIEEASPDATEFQAAVRKILIEKGWTLNLEVRTEW